MMPARSGRPMRSRTAGADMPTRRASSDVLSPGVGGEELREPNVDLNLIGHRLKLSGMRWNIPGATGIITLRCHRASNRWKQICAQSNNQIPNHPRSLTAQVPRSSKVSPANMIRTWCRPCVRSTNVARTTIGIDFSSAAAPNGARGIELRLCHRSRRCDRPAPLRGRGRICGLTTKGQCLPSTVDGHRVGPSPQQRRLAAGCSAIRAWSTGRSFSHFLRP